VKGAGRHREIARLGQGVMNADGSALKLDRDFLVLREADVLYVSGL
jgi:hypothetical protein